MGGGASRQKQEELAAAVAADLAKAAAHPEQERPATPPSNYDPSGARSKAWNKAYKALLDFEPPQNIDPNTLEDDLQSLPGSCTILQVIECNQVGTGSPSANYKPPDRQPDGPTSKVKEHELWCGMKAMSRQQGLLQVQVDIKRRLLAESQAQRVFLWMHTG